MFIAFFSVSPSRPISPSHAEGSVISSGETAPTGGTADNSQEDSQDVDVDDSQSQSKSQQQKYVSAKLFTSSNRKINLACLSAFYFLFEFSFSAPWNQFRSILIPVCQSPTLSTYSPIVERV